MRELDLTLAKKVRVLYPDLVNELEREPRIKDIGFMPKVCQTIEKIELPDNGRYSFNRNHLIIGVVLCLYDPDVLEGWKTKLNRGIRGKLATYFNVCPTAISNHIVTVRGYYQTIKKFKDYTDSISNQIAEFYMANRK